MSRRFISFTKIQNKSSRYQTYNILVKNRNSLDKIMLADFGLSKQIECDYANLSSKYGCPTFVAPEIVNYKQVKKI